jgi:PTH2 family peptidyl-tRNA hydrolase
MSPGKFAVQVAHASVGAIIEPVQGFCRMTVSMTAANWFEEGFRKIVLKVPGKKELYELMSECLEQKVPYFAVKDFGLTELEPNTLTCIGIGPELNEKIDKITGKLRLWR